MCRYRRSCFCLGCWFCLLWLVDRFGLGSALVNVHLRTLTLSFGFDFGLTVGGRIGLGWGIFGFRIEGDAIREYVGRLPVAAEGDSLCNALSICLLADVSYIFMRESRHAEQRVWHGNLKADFVTHGNGERELPR